MNIKCALISRFQLTMIEIKYPQLFEPCQFILCVPHYSEMYSAITITWVTFNQTETSQVQYGIHGNTTTLSLSASGNFTKFVYKDVVRYIHRVVLDRLAASTKYGK